MTYSTGAAAIAAGIEADMTSDHGTTLGREDAMRSVMSCAWRVALTFIVMLALSGSPASAGVRLGVELGGNLTSLRYEHLDAISFITSYWDPGSRACFTGGASMQVRLRGTSSLVTGLRYVQYGNRVKFNFPPPFAIAGEFRIAQHNLAVPLLLELRPFPSKRLLLAAGTEAAVLLNGKMYIDYTSSGSPSTSGSITHQLNRADLSLDAEAGLEFPAGTHTGLVTLRYTRGLVDVQKKEDWGVAWQTRGTAALIGVRW